MGLTQIQAPVCYPLFLDEAKLFTRVDGEVEDGLLQALITAVTEQVELSTGRQLITAQYEFTTKYTTGFIRLPKPPLQSVDKVEYLDPTTLEYVELDDEFYRVSGGTDPAFLVLVNAPTMTDREDAIKITFTCGYGYAEDVPETLKTTMKLMISEFYKNREATSERPVNELPFGVTNLINLHRVWEFR